MSANCGDDLWSAADDPETFRQELVALGFRGASGFGFRLFWQAALTANPILCGNRVVPGMTMNPYVAVITGPDRERPTFALPAEPVVRSLRTGGNDLFATNLTSKTLSDGVRDTLKATPSLAAIARQVGFPTVGDCFLACRRGCGYLLKIRFAKAPFARTFGQIVDHA